MKDMGELKWILGMEVKRDRNKRILHLNQEKYIRDILTTFQMQNAHNVKMPIATGARLSREQSPASQSVDDPAHTNVTQYRALVGKLVYAMVGTRPDIAFAVSQCSRFFSNPGKAQRVEVGEKPDKMELNEEEEEPEEEQEEQERNRRCIGGPRAQHRATRVA